MGKIFDEPKYPVVDRAPSFWRTGTGPIDDVAVVNVECTTYM